MAAQETAAGGGGGIPQQVVTRWRYGDVGDSNFAVHRRTVPLLVGLLCAVVVFVTLCLYLRWRCHRYAPADDPEAEDASSSSAAAASLPGLDAAAIRGLPVKLYRPPTTSPPPRIPGEAEAEADDDQAAEALCSICISALVAGEKVKELPPCGHCFHPDCVDAWLRSQPSCPLCRCLLLAAAKADANDAV
ncbi:RING-H2 finger protein ATL66-like [Miscanthus floridulus]|uniref:RING-H2 finger protein ATL66-like n=1 Tax=Miscanthus floridulus TaxID=154761 RepID=UPI003458136D